MSLEFFVALPFIIAGIGAILGFIWGQTESEGGVVAIAAAWVGFMIGSMISVIGVAAHFLDKYW